MAALVVDAIAGRTLDLSFGTTLPLHTYVGAASVAIGTVSVLVAIAAPFVRSPLVGAAVTPTVALAAWLQPFTLGRAALLAPLALVIGVAVERVLAPLGARATVARGASAGVVGSAVFVGLAAATLAAYVHDPAAWWGLLAAAIVFALPELCGWQSRIEAGLPCAVVSGISVSAISMAAAAHVGTDLRLVAVGVLPLFAAAVALAPLTGWWRRVQATVGIVAALIAVGAFLSLGGSEESFLAATASLAAGLLAASFVGPQEMRRGAAIGASISGTIAAALALDLGGVHVVEAYVATPALWWTALGVVEMRRRDSVPSAVLLPGLVTGLLPSVALALQGDTWRQVAVLLVAAAIVACGAQLRWSTPMAVGAGAIGLLVLRIVGPEVVQLPRWLTLAVVGSVLLVLGATWEARLADVQRLAATLRPRIAALR
jgi:hypothetical protein